MSKIKYVVGLDLSDINKRQLVAVVFGDHATHAMIGQLFGFGEYVVSAGFVDIEGATNGELNIGVGGESESLKIGSVPDLDLKYVSMALGYGPAYPGQPADERLADYERGRGIIAAREKTQRLRLEGTGHSRGRRG